MRSYASIRRWLLTTFAIYTYLKLLVPNVADIHKMVINFDLVVDAWLSKTGVMPQVRAEARHDVNQEVLDENHNHL